MSKEGVPVVGQLVTYHDPHGKAHPALVTNVGYDSPTTWLNVVYVNDDETQRDDYGRKLCRATSVSHHSAHGDKMWGNYWTA